LSDLLAQPRRKSAGKWEGEEGGEEAGGGEGPKVGGGAGGGEGEGDGVGVSGKGSDVCAGEVEGGRGGKRKLLRCFKDG
jgi:hypothetical protein